MSVRTRIPVLDPAPQLRSLGQALPEAIAKVLASGTFIMGPEVAAFEQEVAGHLGCRHAVACNSGTDALILALRGLGLGPGDEVITSPFTFFATAEAISQVGATPVFVDIDPVSMNLDPAQVGQAITARTRALLPVHLFGRPCEMAGLMALARDHDLKVIEDCAQSFGARHHGRATGTIGHAGAFSFFPSKNLGACGDGGLLATDDDRLAETARMLRVHGSRRKYHNEMVGCNSRLDELQAAILRLKLPRLDGWNRSRRQAAATYNRLLAGQDGIRLPSLVDGHVFHQYTVQLPGGGRDQIRALLDEDGICTMVYYPIPCHRLEVYRGSHAEVSCPHAERLAGQVLSLPLWPDMEEDVQVEVAHGLLLAISSIEQTADRRG